MVSIAEMNVRKEIGQQLLLPLECGYNTHKNKITLKYVLGVRIGAQFNVPGLDLTILVICKVKGAYGNSLSRELIVFMP